MNYSGEAADQVLRMTIQGTEVALKLSGRAAERVIALIYTIIKDQTQTAGKTRLSGMLRSGKEITVFSVPGKDLAEFSEEAKRYGVLYCALKDKQADSAGITDIMVYKEDASKINRIVERMGLATVDVADAKDDGSRKEKETQTVNPTKVEPVNKHRSEPTSKSKETFEKDKPDKSRESQKKSVRERIEEIRAKRKDDKTGVSHAKEKELIDKVRAAGKAAKDRAERAPGR